MAVPDEISGTNAKLGERKTLFRLASVSIAATEHAETYPN